MMMPIHPADWGRCQWRFLLDHLVPREWILTKQSTLPPPWPHQPHKMPGSDTDLTGFSHFRTSIQPLLTATHCLLIIAALCQKKFMQPVLFWCWATVYDGGPASKQHRLNAWWLLWHRSWDGSHVAEDWSARWEDDMMDIRTLLVICENIWWERSPVNALQINSKNIVPLDMKGCICHFVKWQIHPFISKEIKYLADAGRIMSVTLVSSLVYL